MPLCAMKGKIFKICLLSFSIGILFLLTNCENETTCGGKVFKGSAEGEIYIISENDSIIIVLEQAFSYPKNDSINKIVHFVTDNSEVIKMNFFVRYESYNENPEFIKEVDSYGDTIFVWFSIREKFKKLSKTNSIVEIECSPIIESSVIDSVLVEIGANKTVNIIEKYSE